AHVCRPRPVGSGLRSREAATRLIQAVAQKVSIPSAAVRHPELITEVAQKFGRCATVVNIDPRRVRQAPSTPAPLPPGERGEEFWEVHINGGRVPTGLEAVAWAKRVEELGAG